MHVIVATDGSRQSLAAAKHLKSFADPTKVTQISVVAVIRPLASVAFADEISEAEPPGPGEGGSGFREAAQGALDAVAAVFDDWGPTVDKEIRSGSPAAEIIEMAKELDELVATLRTRPLDAGPYAYLWIDAQTQRCRDGGRVVNVATVTAIAVNAAVSVHTITTKAFIGEVCAAPVPSEAACASSRTTVVAGGSARAASALPQSVPRKGPNDRGATGAPAKTRTRQKNSAPDQPGRFFVSGSETGSRLTRPAGSRPRSSSAPAASRPRP